jgi:putative transcriptional regulator
LNKGAAAMQRHHQLRARLPGALGALLLTLASSPAISVAGDAPLTAIVITAKTELPDDNFAQSTALVLNNIGPAPVGLIVNRPTKFAVAHLFPELGPELARVHDRIFFGGPVEPETVWFLVRATRAPEHSIKAFDDVYISSSRELLIRLLRRRKPMEGLRIFIGHAGWAPGQLEAEIRHGDWTLGKARADTIFSNKNNHPWPSASGNEPET